MRRLLWCQSVLWNTVMTIGASDMHGCTHVIFITFTLILPSTFGAQVLTKTSLGSSTDAGSFSGSFSTCPAFSWPRSRSAFSFSSCCFVTTWNWRHTSEHLSQWPWQRQLKASCCEYGWKGHLVSQSPGKSGTVNIVFGKNAKFTGWASVDCFRPVAVVTLETSFTVISRVHLRMSAYRVTARGFRTRLEFENADALPVNCFSQNIHKF